MSIILERFRYLSWIAILCSLAGSLLMFIIGALKTFFAFRALLALNGLDSSPSQVTASDVAATYLVESLDSFLIAFVLFIFAYGIFALFISKAGYEEGVLKWIHVPSISYLKKILAEVIVIILFVKFLESALVNLDSLDWEMLVLPVSILLLSVSLKLLDLRQDMSSDTPKED